eukprot:TRINITY_DN1633_c0_g1_i2.p3 TRINITY_DN1633_c0_g1~~TRINITY_DN1633_c0_g1_i2.p3  ORF type:complete len:128 (+),score=34.68 TRINITY_DN1633_c0_g1_i2:160-543(+)
MWSVDCISSGFSSRPNMPKRVSTKDPSFGQSGVDPSPFVESLLVIPDIGVQVITKYYGGKSIHRFVDKTQIKSIVINEGIHSFRVIFYMAFIVKGQDKMIIAFENLLPRLNDLTKVYHGTRTIMLDS